MLLRLRDFFLTDDDDDDGVVEILLFVMNMELGIIVNKMYKI